MFSFEKRYFINLKGVIEFEGVKEVFKFFFFILCLLIIVFIFLDVCFYKLGTAVNLIIRNNSFPLLLQVINNQFPNILIHQNNLIKYKLLK